MESVRSTLNAIRYVNDISYNAKGQIKTISYGNNTSTVYTYGQDLRLSRIFTRDDGRGTNIQDLNYIFDHNGNLTTLTDNLRSNTRIYNYDHLNRLTRAQNSPALAGGYTNFDYQYDSIGNITYKSDTGVMNYGLNAGPHALTSAGGYAYQYDANGNMLVGKNKTLEYDPENRLTKVNEAGRITSFVYDGDGGRVRKTRGDGGGTIASATYIGSLFEIRETTDEGRSTIKHIFAGANRVCSVTKDEARGTTDASYYHSDHLGSSSVITDASGSQVEHYEYTPYGTTAVQEIVPRPSSPIPRNTVHHKFTGKELDSTGLYFYGARYYDPEIGRFITPDTIVQAPYDPQSLNRYTYCRNNPINYVDPTGHSWKSFWKKVGDFFSNIGKGIAANPGAFIGALVGGIAFGFLGSWVATSYLAPAFATGGITAGEAAFITGVEFGIGGFGAGFVGTVAGGGSVGEAFKAGGIGFGIGFGIGGVVGYTYASGMQDFLHGFDSKAYNNYLANNGESYGKIYLSAQESGGSTGIGGSSGADGWGHSWVSLEDNAGNQVSHGWWPGGEGADWRGTLLGRKFPGSMTTVPGLSDSHSIASGASHGWNITKAQYDQASRFMTRYAAKNSWALRTNCADFAVGTTRSASVNVPQSVTFPIADPNRVARWLRTLKN